MAASMNPRSRATTVLALAVGFAGALLCLAVIYRTARLPTGDGTGMQWVVLGPVALLFLGIVVPALIVGVNGLRDGAAPATPAREREARGFATFKAFLVFLAVLVFGVLPLATQLVLLVAE